METILLVTVLAETLVLLGFSAVLLRRVSASAQVDVKAEVAGQLERFNTDSWPEDQCQHCRHGH